jgi:hypothetical protein
MLSDRGFSSPLPEDGPLAFDFNLNSKAFIRYIFGNIDKLAPENTPNDLIEQFKSKPKTINVYNLTNDLDALEQYNKNVVYQCFNNVFNSSTDCYGLLRK